MSQQPKNKTDVEHLRILDQNPEKLIAKDIDKVKVKEKKKEKIKRGIKITIKEEEG